jgi:hypothetical protein
MKPVSDKPIRVVRIKESTYQKVVRFGHAGEPIDSALLKCVDLASQKLAEKRKHELITAEVTP